MVEHPAVKPTVGPPRQIDAMGSHPLTDTTKLPTASPPDKARDIWPTMSAQGIQDALEVCRAGGQLGLITGPSGAGKTTAARATVAAMRKSGNDAYYVSMAQAADSLRPGLLRITHALGLSYHPNMGADALYDALVAHWWLPGSVLVLDEAQFMSDALLHSVRNLWDDLGIRDTTLGIALVGTPDLSERIEGSTGRKSNGLDALRGRLGVTLAVEQPAAEDFTAICAHFGAAGPRAENLVQSVGRRQGGLHNVNRLLEHARRLVGPGGQISLSDLKKAAIGMGVGA